MQYAHSIKSYAILIKLCTPILESNVTELNSSRVVANIRFNYYGVVVKETKSTQQQTNR